MKIDREKFDRWIHSRFPHLKTRGDEYCVDSIFKPDKKKKLWINPEKNSYHCWKTDRSGNVVELICKVDSCSVREAISKIRPRESDVRGFQGSLDSLQEQVQKSLEAKQQRKALFPKGYQTFLSGTGLIRDRCHSYILGRGIDPVHFKIGYCEEEPYKGGIFLPIYDQFGSLVYWTVRMLEGSERYKNPPKDMFEHSKEDIFWFGEHWPEPDSVVFVTEGIIDGMSLSMVDLPCGALLGKRASKTQTLLLLGRKYNVILAFNNDEPGREAEAYHYELFVKEGVNVIGAVIPDGYKDWNQVLVKEGPDFLKKYIPSHIRTLDLTGRLKNLLSTV